MGRVLGGHVNSMSYKYNYKKKGFHVMKYKTLLNMHELQLLYGRYTNTTRCLGIMHSTP